MSIFVLGINHHSAPLDIRERVAFPVGTLPEALASLLQKADAREALILSTCNRTELYAVTETPEALGEWLAAHHNVELSRLQPFLYIFRQDEAARHLFRVASGLDSMVLGETQILGQIKEAARLGEEAGSLGGNLHRLFQRAFSVAKGIRSDTAIGANVISMAAAAVQLAERIFESISEQKLLFIGAGEMIELSAAHFCAHSPAAVTIANRTVERGAALAERFNGRAIRLDEIAGTLFEHDIVISCTASPLPIIGLGLVERSLKARRHRPMFMLDLAVPRDIEPEVGMLDDIFLYTVDDLAGIVTSGVESRQAAAAEAEAMIAGQTADFMRWLTSLDAVPLIRDLRDSVERARRHELDRAMKRLVAGETPEEVLEQLSTRLTNKFLHAPTQALRQAGNEECADMQRILIRLFHLRGHTES
ncbi:MAG: glutamyl-tRNA reductase [Betaproteobacteria bacterium]|nr:glutamyl-tRNA reductase [Betaproteobacteria bacterium]